MEELELISNGFINRVGEGVFYAEISEEVISKYENIFVINRGKEDILNFIWKKYGLRNYRNGLFWFVNPDEYNNLARNFPNVSETAIVFARTNVGNLFLLEKLDIGDSITYLNVHKGKTNVVSTNFEIFIEFDIATDEFWKRDCYGKIELNAVKKHTVLPYECLTFVPALALGGDEKMANLQKVKIKDNLEFLSQLHSK
jgi:hypothetical protein